MKGLLRRNTQVKYESPTTYQSKVMTKVKVLERRSISKVRGPRSWYQMKGLVRRNPHVKYDSPTTYQSKVIIKVQVFADRQTRVIAIGHPLLVGP
jgi:hypothetical protein